MGTAAGANGLTPRARLVLEVAIENKTVLISARSEDPGDQVPACLAAFHVARAAPAMKVIECILALGVQARARADPDIMGLDGAADRFGANEVVALMAQAIELGAAQLLAGAGRNETGDRPQGETAAARGQRAEQLVDAAASPGPAP